MPLIDIHHVALRTRDLEASEHLYVDILGMRKVARPDFDFPGAWLQMGTTMFHLMAGYAALDADGRPCTGGAAVDHLALNASGYDEMRKRFETAGLAYRENDIGPFGIWQLFVKDPDGVTIELNFRAADEPSGSTGPRSSTLGKVTD